MSALFQPANMPLFAVLVPLSAPVFFSLMCGQENSTKVKRKAVLEFSPVTLVTLRKQGPVLSSPWNTSAPSDQITPPPPSLPLPSDTNTAPHQETQHNWSTGLVHDPPCPALLPEQQCSTGNSWKPLHFQQAYICTVICVCIFICVIWKYVYFSSKFKRLPHLRRKISRRSWGMSEHL